MLTTLGIGIGIGWQTPEGAGQTLYSAEARQFFDRLLTLPSEARLELYAALIDGLVADGVWTRLDALYLFAGADKATSLTNLRRSAYMATLNDLGGEPPFVADRGFTGAGVNSNIQLNFNATTASSPNFTRNDGMIAAWSRTTAQVNAVLFDSQTAPGQTAQNKTEIWPKYSSGLTYYTVNGTESGVTAGADSSGLFLTQRTGANAEAVYRNNVSLGSNTSASNALVSGVMIIANGAYQACAGVIGASLDSTQRTALYDRLTTYLTGVGAV